MATVSELLQRCLLQFNSVICSDDLHARIQEVSLQAWRDELGRLRVWAANIGAHQAGQSSLDYRLRDASHIKNQILSLLMRVQELLLDLVEVLEENTDTENRCADEERGDFEEHSEDGHNETEIQQIYHGLIETITHLYRMSMTIRQPSHHDRLIGTKKVDAQPYVFWAKQHVSHKYPHADDSVINRLGFMMARQKAILNYRERHHSKLSQGIDPEDGKSTILSETIITDVYDEANHSHNMVSDAGVSETSYGSTLLEGTDGKGPKLPPIPKRGADQRPFECPYCFYIISVRDDRAWARHIFQDLMPYICVFPECSIQNRLYESRRSWYAHVQKAHPVTGTSYDCFICNQKSLPSLAFQRHVAGHLQELALFYLPQATEDEDLKTGEENAFEGMEGTSKTPLKDDSIDVKQRSQEAKTPIGASDSSPHDDDSEEELWAQSGRASPLSMPLSNDEQHDGMLYKTAQLGVSTHSNLKEKQKYQDAKDDLQVETSQISDEVEHVEDKVLYTLEAKLKQRKSVLESETDEAERKTVIKEIKEEELLEEHEIEKQRKREAALEEWEGEKARVRQKKKEEEQRKEKESREQLMEIGYSEQEINTIRMKKQKKEEKEKEKEKEQNKDKKEYTDTTAAETQLNKGEKEHADIKTTWTKVHRKHLVPETLIAFGLPWGWDQSDTDYIIIKKRITKDFQEDLFSHTHRIRADKVARFWK